LRKLTSESQDNKNVIEVAANEQAALLLKLDPDVNPAFTVVRKNLTAKKVCAMCLDGEPKKLNINARCLSCDGVGLLDDFEKQKWASEQVLGRKIPMPKAIEMKVTDAKDKEDLMKDAKGMSADQARAALKDLDRRFKEAGRKQVIQEVVEEKEDAEQV
jgi:hypothetical protein